MKRSIGKSDADRTAILRALQVKWHPDKNMNIGDEATRQKANSLSATVNEAMRIAKINIKARAERDNFRVKAYRGAAAAEASAAEGPQEVVKTPWGYGQRKKPRGAQ